MFNAVRAFNEMDKALVDKLVRDKDKQLQMYASFSLISVVNARFAGTVRRRRSGKLLGGAWRISRGKTLWPAEQLKRSSRLI